MKERASSPYSSEFLPDQQVEDAVGGRVEADEQVGQVHANVDERSRLAAVQVVAAKDDFVNVRDDLEGLQTAGSVQ